MAERLVSITRGGETVSSISDDQLFTSSGYSSFNDADTVADVDAAFRSQRRVAVGYFTVFLVGVLGVALGTVRSSWAAADQVLGGFSPSFLMAAIGLYGFFVVLGLAAASLANEVDRTMLGAAALADNERGNRLHRMARPARSLISAFGKRPRTGTTSTGHSKPLVGS